MRSSSIEIDPPAKAVFRGQRMPRSARVSSSIRCHARYRQGPRGLRQVEHPRWAARSSNSENGAKPGEARRTRRLKTPTCPRRVRDRFRRLPELASAELRAGYVYKLCVKQKRLTE